MKKLLMGSMLILATGLSTGCTNLNSFQRAEYQSMQAAGLAVQEKKPKVAAALGILPGGGSFYTRQWGLGIADVLLWPASILWDPFAGYAGAEVINYDVSRAYVKHIKAKELADLEHRLEDNQLSQAEFIEKRRAIDGRYNFD